MDKRAENPVHNKRFFLEVKNSPQLVTTLTQSIKKLGGRIESFLNANVNYVVTNRPKVEWPQKADAQSSTASIINSNAVFSRASKMLQSTQNVPKTTDPLEMARKFDKKIIFATELLEFIKKHTTCAPQADAEKVHSSSGTNGRKLSPPYIKVLDNSYKYKTNFKELVEWPEINFDFQPELCPFYKPRKPSISANASQSNKSNTLQGGKPNDRFQTVLTTPIMTTPTLNVNLKSFPTKNASKRKHMTFCEICHKEYEDFQKHLTEDSHSNFLNDNKNFSELFSVIKSLPPFLPQAPMHILRTSRLTKKSFADISNVMPMSESPQSNHQSLNDSLYGRKLPSPEMRSIHLINTWESKQGHGFMAIHDLVNDDRNLNLTVKEHFSLTETTDSQALQKVENNENLPLISEST